MILGALGTKTEHEVIPNFIPTDGHSCHYIRNIQRLHLDKQLSISEQLYLMQLYLSGPQGKHGDAASLIVDHAEGIGLLVADSLHAHGLLLVEVLLLLRLFESLETVAIHSVSDFFPFL